MSSSGSTIIDQSGSVIRYSSNFMRTLRNSDAAKDVPQDIIRRYQQAEFYNAKQQFDPDQIGSNVNRLARDIPLKTDSGGRDNSVLSKDDASLQPQQRQSWTRGCGVSIQAKSDSQGSAQSGSGSGMSSSSKLQQNAGSNSTTASARQLGSFASTNRTMASALPPQPGSLRTGTRADFGYAMTYRPPRESQEFRQNQNRLPFGRGRGALGGRGQEDYDMPSHNSNRFPPPLFQQQGMRHYGGGFGNRGGGYGSSRRHTQSTGDSVPEWFTEGPSDPSMMMELGGELPTSSRSSSPAESLGDESVEDGKPSLESANSRHNVSATDFTGGSKDTSKNMAATQSVHPVFAPAPPVPHTKSSTTSITTTSTTAPAESMESGAKPSGWETNVDRERPASQQADFTYLLWSSLQNDLSSSFGESGSRSGGGGADAVSSSTAEITGSKLWSVWKDDMSAPAPIGTNSGPLPGNFSAQNSQDDSRKGVPNAMENKGQWQNSSQMQPNSGPAGLNLRDWLENAQMAERMVTAAVAQPAQPQSQLQRVNTDPSALRVTTTVDSHSSNAASATSPAPRGLNPNELFAKFSLANGNAAPPLQAAQAAAPVSTQARKSPPVTQMMSVEDLERRLMMKRQVAAKAQQQQQQPGGGTSDKSQEPEREHNQNARHSSNSAAPQRSFYDAAPTNASTQQAHQHHHQQQMKPQQPPVQTISEDNSGVSAGPPHSVQQQQQQQQQQQFASGQAQNPAAMQMQLAHQALLNALAAANSSGGGPAMQQQKMLLANLLQQQQQHLQAQGQAQGNTPSAQSANNGAAPATAPQLPPGLPPFFNMFPPNALAAAAAASQLFYYPQLLQQAQAHAAAARLPGANSNVPPMQQPGANAPSGSSAAAAAAGTSSNVPLRPPFPMPPPGTFPNFPALNPTAAASLMAAALSHFQQQQQQQQQQQAAGKSGSPGPNGTSGSNGGSSGSGQAPNSQMPFANPNVAACAAAAALMATRMGINPHMAFQANQQQGQAGYSSASPFAVASGLLSQPPPMTSQTQNNVTNNPQQQQQQQQQRPSQAESPPRARVSSPVATVANMSSKLNPSFIPTQVMMKNPHTINSSPDTPNSSGKTPTQLSRAANVNKSNCGKANDSPNVPLSYSSVTANASNSTTTTAGNNGGTAFGQPAKSNLWTAEDLERPFMKATQLRDGAAPSANSYSSYPPLHQQSASTTSQRTAGVAAAAAGGSSAAGSARFQEQAHRVVETAHQFSVADLLRGAANANKAAQSSSASYT